MWFVVMNNIFPVGTGITIHERYDLKVRPALSTA
jgi:hypothetical protein